jgi:hypothetical protein
VLLSAFFTLKTRALRKSIMNYVQWLSQARLSQVLCKMASKNAHGLHKTQRMALALTFLERYRKGGDEFLSHIIRVTCDETWVSFVNVEAKEQSKQRMHIHSSDKLEKFKQTGKVC